MKFNIKWFSVTTMIIGTTPLLILFIWCSINGFGLEGVRLFESIHPSGGFSIVDNFGGSFPSRIPGILINTLYAATDSLIAGFGFSAIYNFFIDKFETGKSGK
ncbi:MAG: hypothetical protein E4G96_03335 [Chrysiogenales bacterium]|nr:MAG: hypothetical protein E4G96_03335 [Chrysiogenales bacterium]